ncbi:sushi domain-containing protein 3-like isoform X1 [Xiphophorus maculatus]|uniref:Zgc:162331 n=1 Tax=Xiphophorus maculatus TaxID=8083 RepID=A0A3B5R330_XIPMA|nr:sushi domain-containing protein 3-like isoform X1 [Xiphophorus maculatus]XP_023206027.1 sushi domain-containing protein 3-like isoform X1 [Xiphophorus maculatus]XP_023206028.1 sushi domain-containing protein 3-like isoform X1 [Xiphophorus maculatus]
MPLRNRWRSGGSCLWMLLLLPRLCCLVLAQGSTLSPEDSRSITAAMLPEDWTNTMVPLQPDLQTVAQTPTEEPAEAPTEDQTEAPTEMQTQVFTNNYTGMSCVPVLPPRRGSFYVERGTGMSVGSVLAFWCREGYQLVGSDKISCHIRNGKAQWSNYLPVCEAIPRPEDRGLRVAVLASVVSGIVIFAMSLSFLVCCLQERSSRDRAKKDGRSRRREKRSGRRSECWLETEEGEWEAFPPPKIFHLSQRMDPRLAPDSPLYLTGGLNGYENRGYQRSQESLLKTSLPGLYRSESQLYPHVVLQRVPTPTAPSAPSAPSAPLYLHLPPSTSAGSSPAHTITQSQPRIMAQYPTPTYPPNPNTAVPTYLHPTPAPIYPNPNPPPQRPWQ